MSWYYSKNGTQLGPVEAGEFLAKCAGGEVTATDLVWKEGMADWKQAGQVPELGLTAPQVSTPPPISRGNVRITQPPAMEASRLERVPNYLWQSIVATVFCCQPFGIVGIVYAAKVDGMVARGDIVGARVASKAAKMWTNLAVVGWVVVMLIILVAAGLSQG